MLKYDLDRKSLTRFYTSYIRPVLEYSSIVWDNCDKDEAELLESIQIDAARIITGLRRGTSHDILYDELGWTSLSKRRQDSKLTYFLKILNYETPTYINNILDSYNDHVVPYSLRNNNLRYPKPNSTSFQKSYFPATINLWNNLNPNLANCTSLHSFKQELKKQAQHLPTIIHPVQERIKLFYVSLEMVKANSIKTCMMTT